MALAKTLNSGTSLKQRGQGAVEAILALPVFLTLVCIIFQLFFLGMAQIQLQYAAFYAARVGVVNASDKISMTRAVKRILARSPGLVSLPDGSYEVEILGSGGNDDERSETTVKPLNETLKVRVHWHYPLIVPLTDIFPNKNNLFLIPGRPSVHLQASWAMTMFRSIPEDKSNGKSPQP
jgi:hypothetical protein